MIIKSTWTDDLIQRCPFCTSKQEDLSLRRHYYARKGNFFFAYFWSIAITIGTTSTFLPINWKVCRLRTWQYFSTHVLAANLTVTPKLIQTFECTQNYTQSYYPYICKQQINKGINTWVSGLHYFLNVNFITGLNKLN